MAKRVDANQPEIVQALRQAGCSVQVLSMVGKGCPDLLVGKHGLNYLLEIKDGSKTPSQRKLTSDEQAWHSTWDGLVFVVNSIEDAYQVLGLR